MGNPRDCQGELTESTKSYVGEALHCSDGDT
jgi:hypothetical protein